jgi:hypothetical protein
MTSVCAHRISLLHFVFLLYVSTQFQEILFVNVQFISPCIRLISIANTNYLHTLQLSAVFISLICLLTGIASFQDSK